LSRDQCRTAVQYPRSRRRHPTKAMPDRPAATASRISPCPRSNGSSGTCAVYRSGEARSNHSGRSKASANMTATAT